MTVIDAMNMDYQALNESVRRSDGDIQIDNCLGQRFRAAGQSGRSIVINGVPGNALGAYLDGAAVTVNGNGQDAVGDTMNDGSIVIHGNSGDATGYAMRGGEIYVRGNAGYRAGIHMKAYKEKKPVMVIGGTCGSFLGEYQAGGVIMVLGLNAGNAPLVGYFCGTGMHGGKIILRCSKNSLSLPPQVNVDNPTPEDMKEIYQYVGKYCEYFGADKSGVMNADFCVLTPNSSNPYKQMYVRN